MNKDVYNILSEKKNFLKYYFVNICVERELVEC